MKRNNKKGFTIVELVIVIAVIAILAGVLIPTFAGIITKAQDSAALQEATAIKNAANVEALSLPEHKGLEEIAGDKTIYVVTAKGVWFTWAEGKLNPLETALADADKKIKENDTIFVADNEEDGVVLPLAVAEGVAATAYKAVEAVDIPADAYVLIR